MMAVKAFLLVRVDAYGFKHVVSAYKSKSLCTSIVNKRMNNPTRLYDYEVQATNLIG